MFRPVFFSSFLATFLAFGEKQFWKIAMSPHTVQASSQDIKRFLSQMWQKLRDDCQCDNNTIERKKLV
jgi:hypothetical protein